MTQVRREAMISCTSLVISPHLLNGDNIARNAAKNSWRVFDLFVGFAERQFRFCRFCRKTI